MVARLRAHLRRDRWPRTAMSLIVIATGAAGFLASVALLAAGLDSMPLRYASAVLIAYAVFLGLIRLWITTQEGGTTAADWLDLPLETPFDMGGPGRAMGGGRFGGGGAGGEWHGTASDGFIGSDSIDFDGLDLDEGWLLLIPFALTVCAAVAAVYTVWIAPTMLAEVLIDTVLVSGIYRNMRNRDGTHWMTTALRHTWLAAVLVAASMLAGGWIMQTVVPQASSIGDVIAFAIDSR